MCYSPLVNSLLATERRAGKDCGLWGALGSFVGEMVGVVAADESELHPPSEDDTTVVVAFPSDSRSRFRTSPDGMGGNIVAEDRSGATGDINTYRGEMIE